jgi:hypothetical protein
MERLGYILVLLLTVLCLSEGQQNDIFSDADCGACDRNVCPVPKDCIALTVKDRCGCCDVCAKAEYERCDHPQVPPSSVGEFAGKCGENLECRIRDDLEDGDSPQAACYCSTEDSLCGSDGLTYTNICQLGAAGVTVNNKGPCKSAPVIVSKPENAKDRVGSSVAMVCEATGYPIPTVEWTWTRVDGKTVYLPSDDLHVSVNMRGGPEKWQITGWLQVMEMESHHEGDYTCIAQNELGAVEASARLIVIDDGTSGKKKRRNKRKN